MQVDHTAVKIALSVSGISVIGALRSEGPDGGGFFGLCCPICLFAHFAQVDVVKIYQPR
jgi:hypothetical protein